MAQAGVSKVTKVTLRAGKLAFIGVFLWGVALAGGQPPGAKESSHAESSGAESLYLKLRSVGLDKNRVYQIREASLDRAKLHISLDDGTIAFTEDAGGHTTGAFFRGYGEVLLMPPNDVERESLSLFTGAAVLEETFSSAYFRFNDDVFNELQPSLRAADDPAAFASEWDMTARNLASEDALRLLLTFSDSLPSEKTPVPVNANDHFLHAVIEGNKLGAFDARYDSLASEQVSAGQHKHVDGEDYYDLWTSFTVPLPGNSKSSVGESEGEPPNSDFEVIHFDIHAHVMPVKELEATAILNIVARHKTRRALLFELSRLLQVKQVTADGHPVEFIHNQAIQGSHLAKQGNDLVAVILPAPLQAGQKIELRFEYSGSVMSEAANGLLYVGEHGTWYPNRGFAMASFDMEFRYPAGWTLVATGHRTEKKMDGEDQVSKWTTEYPVPVAGFNLGKYSQTVTHAGKVSITTYATANVEKEFPATSSLVGPEIPSFLNPQREDPRALPPSMVLPPPPPSPSGNAQMVGAVSAKAINFYEAHFGPYPYGELAITQMPGHMSQGWPGLIFLSSYLFLKPEETARLQTDPVRRLMSEQIIAHETAHQWWGDLVNWSSYRDQWIMEGLANYSALMLLESEDPVKFRQVMQDYRDDLMDKKVKGRPLMDAGPVTLGFRLSSSQFPGAYDALCYGRGTWLFHMLRTMMRDAAEKRGSVATHGKDIDDEPFLRALRKLRKNYEDKSISTAELMQVFASELPPSLWYEGHKSLDWFYESWVNGSAVPAFDLRDVKFTTKGNTTVVSGTIIQEHAPDTLVTAVPLYASIGNKNVFLKRVFAEGQETQFHISGPLGTRKILLDPEQTLLARNKGGR